MSDGTDRVLRRAAPRWCARAGLDFQRERGRNTSRVVVFGAVGFFLGLVVLAVTLALLEMWRKRTGLA